MLSQIVTAKTFDPWSTRYCDYYELFTKAFWVQVEYEMMLLLLGVIIIILDSAELYDSVQVLNSERQNCTSKFCDPIVSWTESECCGLVVIQTTNIQLLLIGDKWIKCQMFIWWQTFISLNLFSATRQSISQWTWIFRVVCHAPYCSTMLKSNPMSHGPMVESFTASFHILSQLRMF